MRSSELIHIWTIPACTVREKFARTREMWWRKTAAHLPRQLTYWTLVHCGVRAVRGNEIVPDITYMTVLERTPGPR